MKIIKIEKCVDCPYMEYEFCFYGQKTAKYGIGERIPDNLTLPTWCPLEDSPKEGGIK